MQSQFDVLKHRFSSVDEEYGRLGYDVVQICI